MVLQDFLAGLEPHITQKILSYFLSVPEHRLLKSGREVTGHDAARPFGSMSALYAEAPEHQAAVYQVRLGGRLGIEEKLHTSTGSGDSYGARIVTSRNGRDGNRCAQDVTQHECAAMPFFI